MLFGFLTQCLKALVNFSLSFENIMKTHLTDLLYLSDDRLPSIFSLYLSAYILYLECYQVKIRYTTPTSSYISSALFYLLWILEYKTFLKNQIPSSSFAYGATAKPRTSVEYISIKISYQPNHFLLLLHYQFHHEFYKCVVVFNIV